MNISIIEPSVEILDKVNGRELLKKLESYGRTCYKSESNITDDSAEKYIKMILNRGHLSVIEHEKISARVICDRGCCYDKNTKILTGNGWKFFYELDENELIYTKDNEDILCLMKPLKIIKQKYKGKLINFKTKQIFLSVTPNHNMWIFDNHKRIARTKTWKFLKASELVNKSYSFSKGIKSWEGNKQKYIITDDVMVQHGNSKRIYKGESYLIKDFMLFLGLWMTDGGIEKRSFGKNSGGRRCYISQKKKHQRNIIEILLKKLKLNYYKDKNGFRIYNVPLYEFIKKYFIKGEDYKKSYYITIPNWIKNLETKNLKILLEGIRLGDGTKIKDKGYYVYTASEKFAEDVVEIALKINKTANIYKSNELRYNKKYKIQQKVPTYRIRILNTIKHFYRKNPESNYLTDYNDYVYCVELPKFHRIYVMKEGKPVWCGNSHEIVRHRIGSYSQESTRYCNYKTKGLQFIKPCFWPVDGLEWGTWIESLRFSARAYNILIEKWKCSPQQARSVLPNSLKTEIVITYNLREWRHFFTLRCDKSAHPQMRQIAFMLLDKIHELIPVIFDDLYEKFINGRNDFSLIF